MHQKADCQEYMLKTSDESMTVKNVPISMFTPSVVQFSDIQSVPSYSVCTLLSHEESTPQYNPDSLRYSLRYSLDTCLNISYFTEPPDIIRFAPVQKNPA
jgi:hypothetical protein